MADVRSGLGSIKLRVAIAGLVLGVIAISTGVTVVAIYLNQSADVRAQAMRQLELNLDTAVTIAEKRLPSSAAIWADDGSLAGFGTYALPRQFIDHIIVDGTRRVTDEHVAIYVKDEETGVYLGQSTTFMRDGERVAELPLEDPAIIAAIDARERYRGEQVIEGRAYYVAYQPIAVINDDTAVIGAVQVAMDKARLEGTISDTLLLLLIVGVATLLVLGTIGFVLSSMLTRPILRLAASMRDIAGGNLDADIPSAEWKNEIGDMARAVVVFRESSRQVTQMSESERAASAQRAVERGAMMQELKQAFGHVVDAAQQGDFSKRVDVEFPDHELNAIAASINNLVETVDRGLSETGTVLAALADADLTRRMEGEYGGAFAQLRDDTNAVADKLADIITGLRETSRSLKQATGEILSGANDLSERTTKQAATIEETSAAIEQLATAVTQNAQKAKQASDVAATVSRTADEGGLVMTQATEAMERITASSGKISNIIGMIDDIAFQTNLLALNASVEAARAGEAGKGFAVVAVEVRRLAQSAAEASRDVKVLIEQSSGEVKTGTKLVADASEKLGAMLTSAKTNNALMDAIARESREQASSIDEVSASVRNLDQMTQHNAALVEETNAAIEQSEEQASELDRIIAVFTLDAEQDRAPAPAKAEAPPRGGIKGLQERVRSAAKSYLSQGSAALDKDWSAF